MNRNAASTHARRRLASRAIVIGLGLAAPLAASAQQRTPTSPLDRPGAGFNPRVQQPAGPAQAPAAPGGTSIERAPLRAPGAQTQIPVGDLLPKLPEGDLAEAAVVERALKQGYASRRAALSEEAAAWSVSEAKRGYAPQISAGFRYTRLSDYAPGRLQTFDTPGCLADIAGCQADPAAFQQEVVLQQPILNQYAFNVTASSRLSNLIGVQRYRVQAAEANQEAAEADAKVSRLNIAEQALQAYWELVRARAQRHLASQALEVARTQATQTADRFEAGVITEVESLQARAGAQSYERVYEVAQVREQLAEAQLRDLLRWPEGEPLAPAARLLPLPEAPPAIDGLGDEALRRSPQIAGQRARAEAAEAQVDVHMASMLPTLDLAFNMDTANPNQRIFPQQTEYTTTWDLTLQLGWSLDGAWIESARHSRQQANAEAARIAERESADSLRREVLQAHGDLRAALVAVTAQQTAAASAQERQSTVGAQSEVGMATIAQRDAAASDTFAARLDLVDAIVDAHLADAHLRRVLGADPQELTVSK